MGRSRSVKRRTRVIDCDHCRKFAAEWQRGEWFKPSEVLLRFINSLPQSKFTGKTCDSCAEQWDEGEDRIPDGNPPVEDQLAKILKHVPSQATRWNLCYSFFLESPIEFASTVRLADASSAVKADVLRLSILWPAPDREVVTEDFLSAARQQAMNDFWARIASQSEELAYA
jgi:hypothetical protein